MVGLGGQVEVSLRSRAAMHKCSARWGWGWGRGEVRVRLELGVGAGWVKLGCPKVGK